MAATKAEIAAALGTDEATLDTMIGLVGSLQDAGLTDGAVGAWAATMALATGNGKLEGWGSAIAAADTAASSARQAAVEAIQTARARVDLARARVNSGADPDTEQAAAMAAVTTAGQAVGALATALGTQAAALSTALG